MFPTWHIIYRKIQIFQGFIIFKFIYTYFVKKNVFKIIFLSTLKNHTFCMHIFLYTTKRKRLDFNGSVFVKEKFSWKGLKYFKKLCKKETF